MPEQRVTLWCCLAGKQFLWEHWDEESLLYDCRSGQTHSLTPLAVEIILLLGKSPLSVAAIIDKLTHMFSNLDEYLSVEKLIELLEHFEALGLVEECPQ